MEQRKTRLKKFIFVKPDADESRGAISIATRRAGFICHSEITRLISKGTIRSFADYRRREMRAVLAARSSALEFPLSTGTNSSESRRGHQIRACVATLFPRQRRHYSNLGHSNHYSTPPSTKRARARARGTFHRPRRATCGVRVVVLHAI